MHCSSHMNIARDASQKKKKKKKKKEGKTPNAEAGHGIQTGT